MVTVFWRNFDGTGGSTGQQDGMNDTDIGLRVFYEYKSLHTLAMQPRKYIISHITQFTSFLALQGGEKQQQVHKRTPENLMRYHSVALQIAFTQIFMCYLKF